MGARTKTCVRKGLNLPKDLQLTTDAAKRLRLDIASEPKRCKKHALSEQTVELAMKLERKLGPLVSTLRDISFENKTILSSLAPNMNSNVGVATQILHGIRTLISELIRFRSYSKVLKLFPANVPYLEKYIKIFPARLRSYVTPIRRRLIASIRDRRIDNWWRCDDDPIFGDWDDLLGEEARDSPPIRKALVEILLPYMREASKSEASERAYLNDPASQFFENFILPNLPGDVVLQKFLTDKQQARKGLVFNVKTATGTYVYSSEVEVLHIHMNRHPPILEPGDYATSRDAWKDARWRAEKKLVELRHV